jgi:predicted dehydrogenase
MKKKILIFGCGSVGAHHANAARKLNSDVFITDINSEQLVYLKNKLYPNRYGKWDKKITTVDYKEIFKDKKKYDLIVLGVNPINHLKLLKKCIKYLNFKRILVEKPLFTFNQKIDKKYFSKYKKKIFCGFNHELSNSILFVKKFLKKKKTLNHINIYWKESFKYLLKAHPWIKSLKETYLSDIKYGGGVLHEFSHAVHLTKSLKNLLKFPNEFKFSSKILYKRVNKNRKYDYLSKIFFKSENLKISTFVDGISMSPQKKIVINSDNEKLVWKRISNKNLEQIKIYKKGKLYINKIYSITRPQDFITQMKLLLSNKKNDIKNIECNNFENSLKTTELIKKCIKNL